MTQNQVIKYLKQFYTLQLKLSQYLTAINKVNYSKEISLNNWDIDTEIIKFQTYYTNYCGMLITKEIKITEKSYFSLNSNFYEVVIEVENLKQLLKIILSNIITAQNFKNNLIQLIILYEKASSLIFKHYGNSIKNSSKTVLKAS